MATVTCELTEVELQGDYGDVPSIVAVCSRCGNETESFGTGEASVRRCLVLMREECPRRERNFYVSEED